MELLAKLLATDPATPRLTVYDESTDARLDFSAQTLDNWAAKVGNMLLDELDLTPGAHISINLPPSWQAAVIALGALAAGIDFGFNESPEEGEVVFCAPDRAVGIVGADIVVVTNDPFGRGVVEIGGHLPTGTIDFGPTVRFYGDVFSAPTPALADLVADTLPTGARTLATGWTTSAGFERQVLAPLAAGGSAVIVTGLADAARLNAIATAERVTLRL